MIDRVYMVGKQMEERYFRMIYGEILQSFFSWNDPAGSAVTERKLLIVRRDEREAAAGRK